MRFNSYKINENSEIVISPDYYTGGDVTVTISSAILNSVNLNRSENDKLYIQYQLGETENLSENGWIDYVSPFSVEENVKVNARLITKNDEAFKGPVATKSITTIGVAKIGSTTYKTLSQAIEVWNGLTDNEKQLSKIEMIADTEENITIADNENVKIDLAGFKIIGKDLSKPVINVEGKLNIIDSGKLNGEERIYGEIKTNNNSAIKVNSIAELMLGTDDENVNINGPIITGSNYGIEVITGGKVDFYDGKVIGPELGKSITRKAENELSIDKVPNDYVVDAIIDENTGKEILGLVRTYIVTFNTNGGVIEGYTTENPKTKAVAIGKKYGELPEPTKEGYIFDGWSYTLDSETKITATSIVEKYENHTLIANWKVNNYTIIYNANGGVGSLENMSVSYDQEITLSSIENHIEREGYTFKGWSKQENAVEAEYIKDNQGNIKVRNLTNVNNGIVTLYAVWRDETAPITDSFELIPSSNKITVLFNPEDSGSGINESSIKYYLQKNDEWVEQSSSIITDGIVAGTEYTIKAIVSDNAGNTNERVGTVTTLNLEAATVQVRKDNSQGEVITANNSGNQINTNVCIVITNPQVGNAEVKVLDINNNEIDLTNMIQEGQDNTFNINLETVSGVYTIKVKTSDGINETEEQQYLIYVDKSAPTVEPEIIELTTNSLRVTANEQDNVNGSGIDSVTYIIKKDNEQIASNSTGIFSNILEENTQYTLEINVIDNAGNSLTPTYTRTIKTNELVAESLSLREITNNEEFNASSDENQIIWTNDDIRVSLNNGASGISSTYSIEKVNGEKQTSLTTDTDIETTNGRYILTVTTTDGNNIKNRNYYFSVDKTKPEVTITLSENNSIIPANNSIQGEQSVNVGASVNANEEEGGSGLNSCKFAWLSEEDEPNNETVWTPFTLNEEGIANINTSLNAGNHKLWICIEDNAGNKQIKSSQVLTVKYIVEYDVNGGEETINSQEKVKDVDIILAGSPVKTGYIFKGWALSQNATLHDVIYQANGTYSQNKSIRLYAVWEEIVASKIYNDEEIFYSTIQDAIDAAENGATVKLIKQGVIEEKIKILNGQNITLDTNGKTLISNETTIENLGTITIIGNGIIKSTSNSDYTIKNGTNSSTATFNLSEGEIISENYKAINNELEGRLNVNGGEVKSSICAIDNKGTASITSGIVKTEGGDSAVTINSTGTLNITNEAKVTAIAQNTAIGVSSSGIVNVDGGEIEGKDFGVVNNLSGKVNITGNSSIKADIAVANSDNTTESALIKVLNGTLNGNNYALKNASNGKVIVGDKNQSVSNISPALIGNIAGYKNNEANVNLEFYSGIIKGKTSALEITDNVANIQTNIGYHIAFGEDGEYKTLFLSNKYEVSFDTDGGSEIANIEVNYGETYGILEEPTKAGYTFVKWQTEFGDDVTSITTVQIARNHELKAVYTTTEYSVTYKDLQGGTYVNSGEKPASYTIEDEVILPELTKSGYKFMGWKEEGQSDESAIRTISRGTIGNKELIAVFSLKNASYTIRYMMENANDDEFEEDVSLKEVVTKNKTTNEDLKHGDIITLNESQAKHIENYEFYQVKKSLDGEAGGTAIVSAESNTEIFVFYKRSKFTLSVLATDNTKNVQGSGSYKWGETVSIEADYKNLSGYDYKNFEWNVDQNVSIANTTSMSTTITMPAFNTEVTATAGKDLINYTITYNLDGGNAENVTSYNVETESFTLTEPTKEGYTFNGWTGTDLESETKNLTILKGSTGNKEYTATWIQSSFTLTYNYGDGQVSSTDSRKEISETHQYNEQITLENEAYKEGFVFLGWTEEQGNVQKIIKTLTMPLQNKTLYAMYAKLTLAHNSILIDKSINSTSGIEITGTNYGTLSVISSDTTVATATISENSIIIEGIKNGVTQVTVKSSLKDSKGSDIEGIIEVTVQTSPTSIEITPSNTVIGNVTGYNTINLNKTILPNDANVNNSVTWTSSNDAIATVDSNGNVTGLQNGNVIITVTTSNGKTATSNIVVDAVAPQVTITRNKYNKFDFEVNDESEIVGYKITRSNDEPTSGWVTTGTSGSYTNNTTGTIYVWAKDVAGNIGKSSIDVYTVTKSQGQYTSLKLMADGTSSDTGTEITLSSASKLVLAGTPVFVSASANAGYKITVMKGETEIKEGQATIINEDSTISTIATRVEYNIIYDLDGGEVSETEPSIGVYDEDVTLIKPTKTGYTFTGWTSKTSDGLGPNAKYYLGTSWSNFTSEKVTVSNVTRFKNLTDIENETVKLTAVWTPNNYSIKYNYDGSWHTISATYDQIVEISNLSKAGYSFAGWTSTGLGANAASSVNGTEFTLWDGETKNKNIYFKNLAESGTVTIVPNFEGKKYNITYDLDGGEVSETEPSIGVYDEDVTLIKPTKTGYTFTGWTSKTSDGLGPNAKYYLGTSWSNFTSEKVTAAGVIYFKNLTDIENGTVKLTAVWTPDSYTIGYNLAGGSVDGTNLTSYNTETENITLINPTKEGYIFTGWTEQIKSLVWTSGYINELTGNIETNENYPDSYYTIKTLLEAGKTYTLSGYGTYGASDLSNAFKWIVYNLDGTYKEIGSTTNSYTPTQTCYVRLVYCLASTSSQRNSSIINNNQTEMITVIEKGSTCNRYYTANWSVNTIKITLDNQSADTSGTEEFYYKFGTSTKYADENLTTTLSFVKPQKTGYVFKGYFTETGGKGTIYITESGGFTNNIHSKVSKNTTLYAYWLENKYTVQFDANGGVGNMENQVIDRDVEVNLTKNQYTKEGYNFVGWTTNSNGTGTVYNDEQVVTNLAEVGETKILYAKWEEILIGGVSLNDYLSQNRETELYGQRVSYGSDSSIVWRVFYIDRENYFGDGYNTIYLKADYGEKTALDNTYSPTSTCIVEQMNPEWAKGIKYDGTIEDARGRVNGELPEGVTWVSNEKAAAWLCDTEVWQTRKSGKYYDSEMAKYVIGAPCVEMFVKSYAKYAGNSYDAGYYKREQTGLNTSYGYMYSLDGIEYEWGCSDAIPTSETLYVNTSNKMWLASPPARGSGAVCLVNENGILGSYNYNSVYGVAPLVCLKPGVSLEALDENGNIITLNFNETNGVNNKLNTQSINSLKSNKLNVTNNINTNELSNDNNLINDDKQEIKYNLTINPNGGKYSETDEVTVYSQQTGTSKVLGEAIPNESIYTITYNSNGGPTLGKQTSSKQFKNWILQNNAKGSLEENTYIFGEGNDTITAEYCYQEVIVPTPTREGYTFDGWYSDEECTNKIVDGGKAYIPEGDITLYAKWIKNNYQNT